MSGQMKLGVLSIVVSAVFLGGIQLQAAIPLVEREALISLYQSTDGDHWMYRDNWLGPPGSEGTWYGVTVEGDHVTSIELPCNGLRGSVPAVLSKLQFLQNLNLDNCGEIVICCFTNEPNELTFAEGLAGLPSIHTLSLRNYSFLSLPSFISGLETLDTLILSGGELESLPPDLAGLSSLRALHLEHNKLQVLPDSIRDLLSLESLFLTGNQLQSLPVTIGSLSSLNELFLDENQLESLPSAIGQLQNLEELRLDENLLQEIPTEIGELRDLRSLDLRSNQIKVLPPTIGQMASLRRLVLFENSLESFPDQIGNMSGLEELDVASNALESLPASIGGLLNLRVMAAGDNALQSIPAEIGQLTNLTALHLNDNRLQSLPAELGNLAVLTLLNIRGNQVEALPVQFKFLRGLRRLNLEENRLTALPDGFQDLENLQYLDLSSNLLSAIPETVLMLDSLRELDLSKNRIEGPVPAGITQLDQLSHLNLAGNKLIGALPFSITAMTQLESINLFHNALSIVTGEQLFFLNDLHGTDQWIRTQVAQPYLVNTRRLKGDTLRVFWSYPDVHAADAFKICYRRAGTEEELKPTGIEVERQFLSATLDHLALSTTFEFAVQAVKYPHAGNPNLVSGEISEIAEGTTGTSVDFYFPLYLSRPGEFTGLAVSNYSNRSANLQITAYTVDGTVAPFLENPASFSLPAGAQLSLLDTETFGSHGMGERRGWIIVSSDNPDLGTLLLAGDVNLNFLDGGAASTLRSRRLFFSRVYNGAEAFQGEPAETIVGIANPGDEAVEVELLLKGPPPDQQFEEPDILLAPVQEQVIPPRGAIVASVSEIFGVGDVIESATVEVVTDSGDGVVGMQFVRLRNSLFSLPSYTGALPPTTYSAHFAVDQRLGSVSLQTHLKVSNPGDSWNTATLSARDGLSALLAEPETVGLWPGRSWESNIVDFLDFGIDETPRLVSGSLECKFPAVGQPADLVIAEAQSLKFATALSFESTPWTRAIFSHVANTDLSYTGLAFYNPGAGTAAISLQVFRSDGMLAGETTFELEEHSQRSSLLAEFLPAPGEQAGGTIVVSSSLPIVAQEIFGDFQLHFYSSVPPAIIDPSPLGNVFTIVE